MVFVKEPIKSSEELLDKLKHDTSSSSNSCFYLGVYVVIYEKTPGLPGSGAIRNAPVPVGAEIR